MTTTESWVRILCWPVATVLVALIVVVGLNSINSTNRAAEVKKACVQHGGSIGQSSGWSTCKMP